MPRPVEVFPVGRCAAALRLRHCATLLLKGDGDVIEQPAESPHYLILDSCRLIARCLDEFLIIELVPVFFQQVFRFHLLETGKGLLLGQNLATRLMLETIHQ